MADFGYVGIDKTGKKITGTIASKDSLNVAQILKNKGIYITDIQEKSALQRDINLPFANKVKLRDMVLFCRQFTTMLQAGINILDVIDLIKGQVTNKALGKALNSMYESVKKGSPVSFSMKEYPKIFPTILINMIEAGEISGSIDNSFEKMAAYFEKEDRMKQKVINAMIYPIIILFVALIVLNLLLIFVIPTFVGIFNEMGIELPASTRFILFLGTFMSQYWYVILIVILIIIVTYKVNMNNIIFKQKVDRLKLKIPIFGKISLSVAVSRFSRTLATLMNSGVSLIQALDSVKKVFSNVYLEKSFENVIAAVKGGESLSDSIYELNIFPQLLIVMMRTGEESGTLERMLLKVAEYYENETENTVTRLTTIFEPIIIIFMAVIVGFIMASIMLPMFKLYGSVG